MATSLSQFTFPLRALAQVPVFGALLHCIGKAPNRSSLLAFLNMILLLVVAVVFGGEQGLLWSAIAFGGFIALLLVAVAWEAMFGNAFKAS